MRRRRLALWCVIAASGTAALGASCVLPDYAVSGASGSGANTSAGGHVSGSGAGEQVGGGRGGSGDGGFGSVTSGSGVDVTCTDAGEKPAALIHAPAPHSIAVAGENLFWISGDHVFRTPKAGSGTMTAVGTADDACGLASTEISGQPHVLVRRSNGAIDDVDESFQTKSLLPGDIYTLPNGGSCSIAADHADGYVYFFEPIGQTYVLSYLALPDGTDHDHYETTVTTPLAIATDSKNHIAFVDSPVAGFHVATKAPREVLSNVADPPNRYLGVAAVGTAHFVMTETAPMGMWEWKSATVGVEQVSVTLHDAPHQIASDTHLTYWLEVDGAFCGAVWGGADVSDPTKLEGNHPHPCSLAIDDGYVYWADCQPSGGLFRKQP